MQCKNCLNTFSIIKSHDKKYCSRECYKTNVKNKNTRKHNFLTRNINCIICNEVIENKNTNIKYCSKKCRATGKKIHICVCCGCKNNFYSERKTSKFCSNSCKSKNLKLYEYAHKKSGRSRSKIELFLENKLTHDFPELEIVYNTKNIIGLELDIYIPNLKIAIELNGILHYEPIYGHDKFEKIKERDKQKMIICYNSGIELIVINLGKKGLSKAQKNEIYDEIYTIISKNKYRK